MLAFLRATGPFLLNFVCKVLGQMAKMATTSIHPIFEVRSGAVVRVLDFGPKDPWFKPCPVRLS